MPALPNTLFLTYPAGINRPEIIQNLIVPKSKLLLFPVNQHFQAFFNPLPTLLPLQKTTEN